MKKLTTSDFIARSNAIHNNRYQYSNTIYINSTVKVRIDCPIHGEFEQFPRDHYRGSGCQKCASLSTGKQLAMTIDEWKEKAVTAHGNTYDYSLITTYTNQRDKLPIICKEHGVFYQIADVHISAKAGCPYCSGNKLKPFGSFKPALEEVHQNFYKYPDAEFNPTIYPKINVECPIHGIFQPRIHDHLQGHKCPKCASPGFNTELPGYLYYLKINNGEAYKIGITNRSIDARFSVSELRSIEVIFQIQDTGTNVKQFESKILTRFKEFKYTGPKLLLSGNTELFNTNIFPLHIPQSLNDIKKVLHESTG